MTMVLLFGDGLQAQHVLLKNEIGYESTNRTIELVVNNINLLLGPKLCSGKIDTALV